MLYIDAVPRKLQNPRSITLNSSTDEVQLEQPHEHSQIHLAHLQQPSNGRHRKLRQSPFPHNVRQKNLFPCSSINQNFRRILEQKNTT
ncbi:hypothetical protein M758_3G005400 [Ceratodon purpureus]|uniref:Uncharacterized protein n=1 Tax=Ceratodon purpureus TaxID=3225 RepID=A0A8T0IG05_CERPU|nr:hypothetical protein KC19_3G007400 [Ceratodon purpureus]KAG0621257.1 hypothetical protein M758_3G005400 [Ceratodon purpureus]